jgi:hypothetical protein
MPRPYRIELRSEVGDDFFGDFRCFYWVENREIPKKNPFKCSYSIKSNIISNIIFVWNYSPRRFPPLIRLIDRIVHVGECEEVVAVLFGFFFLVKVISREIMEIVAFISEISFFNNRSIIGHIVICSSLFRTIPFQRFCDFLEPVGEGSVFLHFSRLRI